MMKRFHEKIAAFRRNAALRFKAILMVAPCLIIIAIALSHRIICAILICWYRGVLLQRELAFVPSNSGQLETTITLEHHYLQDASIVWVHITVPETLCNMDLHAIVFELALTGVATTTLVRLARLRYFPWLVQNIKAVLLSLPMIMGRSAFEQSIDVRFDMTRYSLRQYHNISVRISPGTLDYYDAEILFKTKSNHATIGIAILTVGVLIFGLASNMHSKWFNIITNSVFTSTTIGNESKPRSIRSSDSSEGNWSSN